MTNQAHLCFLSAVVALVCIFATDSLRAQSETGLPSISSVLAKCWQPQYLDPGTWNDPLANRLCHVASVALSGHFSDANRELREIRSADKSHRTSVLALLFEKQIADRQYSVEGGGGQYGRGDLQFWRLRDRGSQFDQLAAIESLPSGVSDQVEQLDLSVAARLSSILSDCTSNPPVSLRLSNYGQSDPLQLDTLKRTVEGMCSLQGVSWPATVLDPETQEILKDLAGGNIAASLSRRDDARQLFEHGFLFASQNSRLSAASMFAIRLGDLELCPLASAATLCLDLASDNLIRTMVHNGVYHGPDLTVSAAQIAAARSWYARAKEKGHSVRDLALRDGLILYLTHDPGAPTAYRQLLDQQPSNSSRLNSLAKASYAILTGSDTFLKSAMADFVSNEDVGGLVSIAELSRAVASNYLDSGDVERTILTLTNARDSLLSTNTPHALADMDASLADVYGRIGASDKALEFGLQALRARQLFLKQASASTQKDTGLLVAERETEVGELMLVTSEYRMHALTERDTKWNRLSEQYQELTPNVAQELEAQFPAFKEFLTQYSKMTEANVLYAREASWYGNTHRCDSFMKRYKEFYDQSRALANNYPLILFQTRTIGAQCDPAIKKELLAELADVDPAEDLLKTLTTNQNMPGPQAQRAMGDTILRANVQLESVAFLAENALLLKWSDGIIHLGRQHPEFAQLTSAGLGYRIRALLGLEQYSDVDTIVAGLLADKDRWAKLAPQNKIFLLSSYAIAESSLGRVEQGFAALEKLKIEQDIAEELNTGVQSSDEHSAKAAMLRRKAVDSPNGLSGPEESELEGLERKSSNPLSPNLNSNVVTVEKIQSFVKNVPSNTDLLFYYFTRNALFIWHGTHRNGVQFFRSSCSFDEALAAAAELRVKITSAVDNWQSPSRKLYTCLLPLQALSSNDSTIVVSLPEELTGLPFEILLGSDGDPILEHHPVVYTRYAGDYRESAGQQNPDTDDSGSHSRRRSLVVGVNGTSLTNAENEARDVSTILDTAPFLGSTAQPEAVLNALRTASLIHFASHVNLSPDNPYLSSLDMGGGKQIYAWELFQNAPNASLVFLSGCQTDQAASGPFVFASAYGANGLAAFFQHSGTSWTVAALWRVDDQSAKRIVQEFYKALATHRDNPASALQKAKRSLATEGVWNPFYYAPFVVSVRDASWVGRPFAF